MLINDSPKKQYVTSDLSLASALLAAGADSPSIDKTNERRVNFIFELSENDKVNIDLFWSDQLLLNARTYFEATRNLKNRLYSD